MQQGKKHEPFPITGEGAWASKEKLIERKKERKSVFLQDIDFFYLSKSKNMDKITIFSLLQEPIWPHLPSYPQTPTVQK